MASISDIGNGYGYIYQVENTTLKVLAISKNDADGERSMKNIAVIDAPISANKSATGLVRITNAAGAGTIAITVNGVSILASPYSVATTNETTEAIGLAAEINAYTPVSGYKYSAYNVGDTVYLQSPVDVGSLVNGYAIAVSVTGGNTTTDTDFSGGATTTAVYDELIGRRYYLNADYNSSGVTNTLPAPTNALTNAIEITKHIVARGMQVGIPSVSVEIADGSADAERLSSTQLVFLSSPDDTDTLVFLSTNGFVDGDVVYIKSKLAAITVESAPVTAYPVAFKNIYLSSDQPFDIDSETKVLMLQYGYNETIGASVFMEVSRSSQSLGQALGNIGTGEAVYKGLNGITQEFKRISSTAPNLTFSTVSDSVVLGFSASLGGWNGVSAVSLGAGFSDGVAPNIFGFVQLGDYVWDIVFPALPRIILRGQLSGPASVAVTDVLMFTINGVTTTKQKRYPIYDHTQNIWAVMEVRGSGGNLQFWAMGTCIPVDTTAVSFDDILIDIGD